MKLPALLCAALLLAGCALLPPPYDGGHPGGPPPTQPPPTLPQCEAEGCDCWAGATWRPCPAPTPQPCDCWDGEKNPCIEPPGCAAPQGVEWIGPGPVTTTKRSEVLEVLRTLAFCEVQQDCPLPHDTQQTWMARVVAALRERGNCAGQHENGISDEIAVRSDAADGSWEGYAIYNCTPPRPGEDPHLDTCPIVGRGKVRWAVPRPSWIPAAGHPDPPPVPTPTHTPTPGPTPTPAPEPTPTLCSLVVGPNNPLNAKLKIRTGGAGKRWADVTFEYFYGSKPDGSPAGPCKRRWCDIGVDGGPTGIACQEALVGVPQWSGPVRPGRNGNPFLADIVGPGTVTVCAEKTHGACATVEVPAQVALGTNPGCGFVCTLCKTYPSLCP